MSKAKFVADSKGTEFANKTPPPFNVCIVINILYYLKPFCKLITTSETLDNISSEVERVSFSLLKGILNTLESGKNDPINIYPFLDKFCHYTNTRLSSFEDLDTVFVWDSMIKLITSVIMPLRHVFLGKISCSLDIVNWSNIISRCFHAHFNSTTQSLEEIIQIALQFNGEYNDDEDFEDQPPIEQIKYYNAKILRRCPDVVVFAIESFHLPQNLRIINENKSSKVKPPSVIRFPSTFDLNVLGETCGKHGKHSTVEQQNQHSKIYDLSSVVSLEGQSFDSVQAFYRIIDDEKASKWFKGSGAHHEEVTKNKVIEGNYFMNSSFSASSEQLHLSKRVHPRLLIYVKRNSFSLMYDRLRDYVGKAGQMRSRGDEIFEFAESPEQFDEAKHCYEEAISYDESLRPVLQERLNNLEKIERSQRAQGYENQGDFSLGKKRFREACDLYKIAMRSAVVNTSLYLRIREKEDYVTKIMYLETASSLVERGEECLKNSSYTHAKEVFAQALKLNPEYVYLQSIINSIEKTVTIQSSANKVSEANIAMKAGRYKLANQLYLDAISLVPEKYDPLRPVLESLVSLMQAEEALIKQRSGLIALEDKKYSVAISLITEAIQLLPNESLVEHAFFLCDRALVYFEMKDFDTSIQDCQSALKLRPDLAIAYLRLGSAQFELNMYNEASHSYEKAIKNDPSLAEQVKVKVRQVNTAKEVLQRKEREAERARVREEEKKIWEEKRARDEQLKKEKQEKIAQENIEKLERSRLREEEKRMRLLLEKEQLGEKVRNKEVEKEKLKREKAERDAQRAADRERARAEKERERERIRLEKEQKALEGRQAIQEEIQKQKDFLAEVERAEAKSKEIEREKESEREKARLEVERIIAEREKLRQEKLNSETSKKLQRNAGPTKDVTAERKLGRNEIISSEEGNLFYGNNNLLPKSSRSPSLNKKAFFRPLSPTVVNKSTNKLNPDVSNTHNLVENNGDLLNSNSKWSNVAAYNTAENSTVDFDKKYETTSSSFNEFPPLHETVMIETCRSSDFTKKVQPLKQQAVIGDEMQELLDSNAPLSSLNNNSNTSSSKISKLSDNNLKSEFNFDSDLSYSLSSEQSTRLGATGPKLSSEHKIVLFDFESSLKSNQADNCKVFEAEAILNNDGRSTINTKKLTTNQEEEEKKNSFQAFEIDIKALQPNKTVDQNIGSRLLKDSDSNVVTNCFDVVRESDFLGSREVLEDLASVEKGKDLFSKNGVEVEIDFKKLYLLSEPSLCYQNSIEKESFVDNVFDTKDSSYQTLVNNVENINSSNMIANIANETFVLSRSISQNQENNLLDDIIDITDTTLQLSAKAYPYIPSTTPLEPPSSFSLARDNSFNRNEGLFKGDLKAIDSLNYNQSLSNYNQNVSFFSEKDSKSFLSNNITEAPASIIDEEMELLKAIDTQIKFLNCDDDDEEGEDQTLIDGTVDMVLRDEDIALQKSNKFFHAPLFFMKETTQSSNWLNTNQIQDSKASADYHPHHNTSFLRGISEPFLNKPPTPASSSSSAANQQMNVNNQHNVTQMNNVVNNHGLTLIGHGYTIPGAPPNNNTMNFVPLNSNSNFSSLPNTFNFIPLNNNSNNPNNNNLNLNHHNANFNLSLNHHNLNGNNNNNTSNANNFNINFNGNNAHNMNIDFNLVSNASLIKNPNHNLHAQLSNSGPTSSSAIKTSSSINLNTNLNILKSNENDRKFSATKNKFSGFNTAMENSILNNQNKDIFSTSSLDSNNNMKNADVYHNYSIINNNQQKSNANQFIGGVMHNRSSSNSNFFATSPDESKVVDNNLLATNNANFFKAEFSAPSPAKQSSSLAALQVPLSGASSSLFQQNSVVSPVKMSSNSSVMTKDASNNNNNDFLSWNNAFQRPPSISPNINLLGETSTKSPALPILPFQEQPNANAPRNDELFQNNQTIAGIDSDEVKGNDFPMVAWLRPHNMLMYRWSGNVDEWTEFAMHIPNSVISYLIGNNESENAAKLDEIRDMSGCEVYVASEYLCGTQEKFLVFPKGSSGQPSNTTMHVALEYVSNLMRQYFLGSNDINNNRLSSNTLKISNFAGISNANTDFNNNNTISLEESSTSSLQNPAFHLQKGWSASSLTEKNSLSNPASEHQFINYNNNNIDNQQFTVGNNNSFKKIVPFTNNNNNSNISYTSLQTTTTSILNSPASFIARKNRVDRPPLLKTSRTSNTSGFVERLLEIPREVVGLIIGLGGKKIKELCTESGAKIQFRVNKTAEREGRPGLLELQGSFENVDKGLYLVWELLQTLGKEYNEIPFITLRRDTSK